jgi:chromate transporter
MTLITVYLLLVKATLTSFSGMASLPQIRQDFVETRRLMTDEQLTQAVLVGRASPGPVGAYVVSVGYFAAGWSGAVAGWLAMITPALLAIPLLASVERWLHVPRMRSLVDAVIITGSALLIPAGIQLARAALLQLWRVL